MRGEVSDDVVERVAAILYAKYCDHDDGEQTSTAAAIVSLVTAHERARCVERLREEAERIKHTSHADGLGMGNQYKENCYREAAALLGEP